MKAQLNKRVPTARNIHIHATHDNDNNNDNNNHNNVLEACATGPLMWLMSNCPTMIYLREQLDSVCKIARILLFLSLIHITEPTRQAEIS